MTDVHHHDGGTVIKERDSYAGVLAVLIVAALIGFFVWLIGFSGVVINRDGGGSTTKIEQNNQPADQPADDTQQQPAPGNT